MGSFKSLSLHSIGQYIITLTLIFGGQFSLAQAKKKQATTSKKESSKADSKSSSSSSDSEIGTSKYNSNSGSAMPYYPPQRDACLTSLDEYNRARREFTDACGSAGLGGLENCRKQVSHCQDVAVENSGLNGDGILEEFARTFGVSTSQVGSRCPKYSGQGYFERRDKYEKDFEDTKEKIADIEKETAEIEADFNKEVQRIQKDIAEAQEEYQKMALDVKKEQREEDMALAKAAADTAEKLRVAQTTILLKRHEINNIYTNLNTKLIDLTKNMMDTSCQAEIVTARTEYIKILGSTSGNAEAHSSKAGSLRSFLRAKWASCTKRFQAKRQEEMTKAEQAIEMINDTINNTQSTADNLKQQLESMTAQSTEAKNDRNTSLTNAQKSLQDKISRATSELQALQQTTQKKAQSNAKKQDFYEKRTKDNSAAIARLGPEPEDQTSTTKISEVGGKYSDFAEAEMERDANCSSSSSSKSKKGSSKPETAQ